MPRSRLVPDVASSRPIGAAIAVALALWLLGGCSFGGTDPAAAPTSAAPTVAAPPTPTPAPTPSPTTATKPERPAAMDTVDLNGAIATATYFLSLYGYAPETGDLTDWDSLSHPECTFCSGFSSEVRRMVALGQHQVGTGITASSTSGVEVTTGTFFSVDVVGAQGGWTVFDKDGKVVEQDLATKPVVFHMVVVRESGTWLVRAGQPERTNG